VMTAPVVCASASVSSDMPRKSGSNRTDNHVYPVCKHRLSESLNCKDCIVQHIIIIGADPTPQCGVRNAKPKVDDEEEEGGTQEAAAAHSKNIIQSLVNDQLFSFSFAAIQIRSSRTCARAPLHDFHFDCTSIWLIERPALYHDECS